MDTRYQCHEFRRATQGGDISQFDRYFGEKQCGRGSRPANYDTNMFALAVHSMLWGDEEVGEKADKAAHVSWTRGSGKQGEEDRP